MLPELYEIDIDQTRTFRTTKDKKKLVVCPSRCSYRNVSKYFRTGYLQRVHANALGLNVLKVTCFVKDFQFDVLMDNFLKRLTPEADKDPNN